MAFQTSAFPVSTHPFNIIQVEADDDNTDLTNAGYRGRISRALAVRLECDVGALESI